MLPHLIRPWTDRQQKNENELTDISRSKRPLEGLAYTNELGLDIRTIKPSTGEIATCIPTLQQAL